MLFGVQRYRAVTESGGSVSGFLRVERGIEFSPPSISSPALSGGLFYSRDVADAKDRTVERKTHRSTFPGTSAVQRGTDLLIKGDKEWHCDREAKAHVVSFERSVSGADLVLATWEGFLEEVMHG